MNGDIRNTIRQALITAKDVFPEGSGLFNNTKVALGRLDHLVDVSGTAFSSERLKTGILTIIDAALSGLEERAEFAFVADDLAEARECLQEVPVL